MSRGLATIVYTLGILGLFLLDRDKNRRASGTLWIPVVWLALGASRNFSEWLEAHSISSISADHYLEGSPLDAVIFAGLELAAVVVLAVRHARSSAFLRSNGPLVVFFVYCAVSVLWSDYPFVAFKRW